ncbi:MAG: trimethylamine methyltransferase family protein [Gammaproteobacteria bacterium]|nr:trimethylamine methyltransferase family protein [Gammaproteobacteria bacterium]
MSRRRSSTRDSRRSERKQGFAQLPFAPLSNPYPPMEILSADQLETIHQASLKILRDIGLRVESPTALKLLTDLRADVDHDNAHVRFEPALIEELLQGLPSEFTIHARNPQKTVRMGGNSIVFASVCGPSFVSDLDLGRRAASQQDMENFVRLSGSLNILHHEGGSGPEPLDLPPGSRHLEMMYAQITLTDKGWQPSWLDTASRARDCIEMAKIALQTDDEGLKLRPAIIGGLNTNSPLLFDEGQADGMRVFAEAGQPVHITPFTLAGAMAPATVAGAVTLQNAEALGCIALTQAAVPGAPTFYGHFTSNVDMRTGSPAFGTPEYAQSVIISGQLARRYKLPLRSSSTTASACVDLQATYESDMSINACIQAHVNNVMHAGGWLEGGLTCSFEKLILDAELLQMQAAFLQPVTVDEDSLGLEAIEEVGPGGHFFGSAHTLARYENAFYQPILSDWRNFESWHEDGAKNATQRANEIWKKLLQEYEKPPIDPAIEEELQAYMARRKEQIADE